MDKEETLLQKRLLDLANTADRRNIVTFTDFLNLNELNIFHRSAQEFAFVRWALFGGYESAERQIIAFIPDALSYLAESGEVAYPLGCVRIRPLAEKYAEALTHRDYLGAVLNLGIERSTIGDILLEEHRAWIFCLQRMAPFLCQELTRVRHTQVRVEAIVPEKLEYRPKTERIRGSLASVRLDSLLSLAFQASRSSLCALIESGKVFVNGKLVTSNACRLKENDLISVRGWGRFRYLGVISGTRKGRLLAEIEKFV